MSVEVLQVVTHPSWKGSRIRRFRAKDLDGDSSVNIFRLAIPSQRKMFTRRRGHFLPFSVCTASGNDGKWAGSKGKTTRDMTNPNFLRESEKHIGQSTKPIVRTVLIDRQLAYEKG
jgi:hypothetical protein